MTAGQSFTRSVTSQAGMDWLTQLTETFAESWDAAPDVPDDDRLLFELAVFEVADNIIKHSVPTPTWYRCELDVNPQRLAAVLQDNANRTSVHLDAARMPDEMSEGGRGLALAKAALDILQYDAAEGNCWTLVRLLG